VFPLAARRFSYQYRAATHALHLHDYVGTIRLDSREFALEPGTLTVSPALGVSSYDLPRPGSHWCILFHPEPVARRAARIQLPLLRRLGDERAEAAERFAHVARLFALAQRGGGRSAVAAIATSIAMQDLLLWIAMLEEPGHAAVTASRSAAVDRLIDILHRELDEPLRVPDLARQVGLSQNYLARLFRGRTGMTIPRYLLLRRIETARLLLGTTNLPVKLIAARVGIPDPQHFNKQFRRLTGLSPTAARNRR
jgi:AraC-like DNA-binding protein